MSYCPVCNGLYELEVHCPRCKHTLDDEGRLTDYFGDYSPYREIDHAKLNNGMMDVRDQRCIHILSCPFCFFSERYMVREIEQKN